MRLSLRAPARRRVAARRVWVPSITSNPGNVTVTPSRYAEYAEQRYAHHRENTTADHSELVTAQYRET